MLSKLDVPEIAVVSPLIRVPFFKVPFAVRPLLNVRFP